MAIVTSHPDQTSKGTTRLVLGYSLTAQQYRHSLATTDISADLNNSQVPSQRWWLHDHFHVFSQLLLKHASCFDTVASMTKSSKVDTGAIQVFEHVCGYCESLIPHHKGKPPLHLGWWFFGGGALYVGYVSWDWESGRILQTSGSMRAI